MWTLILLALLPTSLVIADVDPVVPATPLTDETPVTVYEAPQMQPTVTAVQIAPAKSFDLHLKPSLSSPTVMKAAENELIADAQETGIVADGLKWMSVERPVKLTGFVDKKAVDKNLDVAPGTIIWTTEAKTAQLSTVDNPADVRLLDVDRMGRVEVKEPRVLYYGLPMAPSPAAAPTVSDAPASSRRGSATETTNPSYRMLEGTLRKSNPLFGRKYFLEDGQGQRICRIDPNSPIGALTFEQYVDRRAVFVGELHDYNGTLVLTVRSIRMR